MTRRILRIGLIAFAGLLVLVVAAGAIATARFDPNTLKPRIVAAVQQATGRQLSLKGAISLRPSLWPTAELSDVALANPPGFSRPDMATLERLDVQLALWPLLFREVQIEQLVLVKPDIRLETNAQGSANWRFTPAPAEAAPAKQQPAAPQPASSGESTAISVADLRIENGTFSYRDDATGRSSVLILNKLDAHAASPQANLKLTADGSYDRTAFTLAGTFGSLQRLLDSASQTPWPVQASVQIGSAKLSADGSLRQPLQARGYSVALMGNVPDVAALAPLLPTATLPPLHDLRFSARVADNGSTVPTVTELTLHAGAAELDSVQPGLKLEALDVSAARLNDTMHVKLQGALQQAPLALSGTLGPPAALLATSKPAKPYPVDLSGSIASAKLTVKGTIDQPVTLKGVNLQLGVDAPDLAALSALAHRPLPAGQSVAFTGRLVDQSGGLAHGFLLRDMQLHVPAAQMAGEIGVTLSKPPTVTAKLDAQQVDADTLAAAFRPAETAAPVANPGATPAPTTPAPAPAPATPQPAQRLFPDTPLPFAMLRQANADVAVTAKEVKSGGTVYRDVKAHLLLRDGKLRLDPFAAELPEGHLALTLSADGSAKAPPVAITVHAPGLALQPLLAALHQPAYATGKLEVRADLHGVGLSPHAIAAGLDGTVGVALQHGTVDTALLEKLLGPALAKANVLSLLGQRGDSQVECFAFRMDAQHGIGEVRTLVLSSSLLSLDGSGSVNLGDETLALRVRPQGRVGGTGFVVPVRVTGSLRDPAVSMDAAGAVQADIGSLAGGKASPLGLLAGVLGGSKQQVGGGESCAGPLALARGEKVPEQPPAAAAKAPAAQPAAKPANPADLLRRFLR